MKHQSLIERFFEGSLTEEEQAQFDEFRAQDPEFRKEVEFQIGLKEVIGHYERSKVKEQLRSFEAGQNKPVKRRWFIAATITLFVLISGLWYFQNQNQEPEALFVTHFEPYRNVVMPIERNGEPTEQKARAFYAYEQGEYEEALEAFIALSLEDKDPTVVFYMANTHLALEQPQPAIELLKTNINQIDSLRDKHFWYLALAYLKAGDRDQAIMQLEFLLELENSTFKHREAQGLLEELR